jgi:hypothetical protein
VNTETVKTELTSGFIKCKFVNDTGVVNELRFTVGV